MKFLILTLIFSMFLIVVSQLTVNLKIRRYIPQERLRMKGNRTAEQWLYKRWKGQAWHASRLIKSGGGQEGSQRRAKLWLGALLIIGLLAGVVSMNFLKGLLAVGTLEICFITLTAQATKQRKNQFNMAVYKVYRALSLQLTSGMSIVDSLKRIHEVVEPPFMKEALHAYTSTYLQTMDVDKATSVLTQRVEGQEVQILATVLRQGIVSGDYYSLLERQEKIMLRHYYQALELETQWIKVKGIAIAVGISLLIFTLLVIPIFYEMVQATQQLFSN